MIRKRLGRFATIFTSAAMALALLGVGTVTAANPSWDIEFSSTPQIVAAGNGNDAGFIVSVVNHGPSQINALSVTLTATDTVTPSSPGGAFPSYLSTFVYLINGLPQPECTTTAPIRCELGTFVDDQRVTFTVAFAVPAGTTGTFDLDIAIRAGTGDTPSDGGNSRGDARTETARTPISSSANFDGGFAVGGDDYATMGDLRRANPQNSALTPPRQAIPVTIEDGVTVTCPTTNAACTGLIGQWTQLNVNNDELFGTKFKVTLFIWGGAVPGGVEEEDVHLVHILGNGTIEVVSERCTFVDPNPVPTNAGECITVTKAGNNWKIVAWLFKNGPVRGGI